MGGPWRDIKAGVSGSVQRSQPWKFKKSDNVDDISVGFELKFLVPFVRPGEADPEQLHDRRPVLFAQRGESAEESPAGGGGSAAGNAGVQRRAYDSIASAIGASSGRRAIATHDIHEAGRQERDFWNSHWIIKKANSAEPGDAETSRHPGYGWVPVEICSPKLRWKRSSMEDDVGAVLTLLSNSHRVAVNYTCDVHVHIGLWDGRPFSLATLKKLAVLLWLAEPVLRAMRDPASPNYENVYTWGAELTKYSRLARHILPPVQEQLRRPAPPAPIDDCEMLMGHMQGEGHTSTEEEFEVINAIWKAQSHQELGQLLSGPEKQYRRLGFNFSAMGEEDERARTGPKTVEFRALEGTLDPALASGWVRICCTLVEVAAQDTRRGWFDAFSYLLRQNAGDSSSLPKDQLFKGLMDRLKVDGSVYEPIEARIREINSR